MILNTIINTHIQECFSAANVEHHLEERFGIVKLHLRNMCGNVVIILINQSVLAQVLK